MMQKSHLEPSKTLLTCEKIACSRRGRRLFEGLSFELYAGTTMALSGSNGSGKSSLLKIVAGLLSPDNGTVMYGDTPIHTSADYEGELVYIGHKNAIKPEATVRENVMFPAEMSGSPYLAAAAIEYFSLGVWLDMPAGAMSAGWQRRVALTKLITTPAKIWLLDEAANNLDAEGSQLLGELIKSRVNAGGAVMLAAHGLPTAEEAKGSGLDILSLADFAPKHEEEI
jgi:heme exporter protein A